MAGFLYFVPGSDDGSLPNLIAHGLGHAFESPSNAGMTRGPGPSGGRGLFIAPPCAEPPEIGFFPVRQVWREMVGGKAWAGFEPARRPRPSDVARGTTIGGYEVLLGDGARWTVPIGRLADGSCALEQALDLGADGTWRRGPVVPSQARLWAIAQRVWDLFAAQSGAGVPPAEQETAGKMPAPLPIDEEAEMPALCVELLAANYRLGVDEVAALGLLTTANRRLILWAVADVPSFLRLADERADAESKKNGPPAPDGSSTPPGGGA